MTYYVQLTYPGHYGVAWTTSFRSNQRLTKRQILAHLRPEAEYRFGVPARRWKLHSYEVKG